MTNLRAVFRKIAKTKYLVRLEANPVLAKGKEPAIKSKVYNQFSKNRHQYEESKKNR